MCLVADDQLLQPKYLYIYGGRLCGRYNIDVVGRRIDIPVISHYFHVDKLKHFTGQTQ